MNIERIKSEYPLGDKLYWDDNGVTFGVREKGNPDSHDWWHIWQCTNGSNEYEKNRIYQHTYGCDEEEKRDLQFDNIEDAIKYMHAHMLFTEWRSANTEKK